MCLETKGKGCEGFALPVRLEILVLVSSRFSDRLSPNKMEAGHGDTYL